MSINAFLPDGQLFVNASKQERIKELIELGNGVRGHRVSGRTKAETKNNIRNVFAKSRKSCLVAGS